jgi:uncharacterized Tic20 family protein
MDSLGGMRASEEEELHAEGPGSDTDFKVFGRPATKSTVEAAARTETVATDAPRTEADDPFAAMSDDADFRPPTKPASGRSTAPSVPSATAPRPTRASHEVLEADFPFAAPRAPRTSAGNGSAPATPPLPPVASQAAPAIGAPATSAAAEPPRAAPAHVPEPPPIEPTPALSGRPDWYRDPAFWVHAVPLAGTVLILTGFGLVPGLLIENTAGRRDDFVRDQAREAINFQLNYLLLNLAALITFTAPVIWPLSLAFGIVLPIQAALDVKAGKRHRYPLVPRWLD